jgi:hypothetical protein
MIARILSLRTEGLMALSERGRWAVGGVRSIRNAPGKPFVLTHHPVALLIDFRLDELC